MSRKRQKEMPPKDSYYDDIVEQLKLELPDKVQKSLVQDITAEMQFKSPESFAPTLASLIRNIYPWLDPFQMCLNIGEIFNGNQLEQEQRLSSFERALVEQQSMPPSSVTWDKLVDTGRVSLTFDDFLRAAKRKQSVTQLHQFDLEKLSTSLKEIIRNSYLNEAYLSVVCSTIFGHLCGFLEAKFHGTFSFEVQPPLMLQRGFSDVILVNCVKETKLEAKLNWKKTKTVVAVVKLKTNVPITLECGDQSICNSLAQLVYYGCVYAEHQKFMPLLALSNCATWHMFDLGEQVVPQKYCNVIAHVGQGATSLFPTTSATHFDAVAVFSEIVEFMERNPNQFSASQQQPAVVQD